MSLITCVCERLTWPSGFVAYAGYAREVFGSRFVPFT